MGPVTGASNKRDVWAALVPVVTLFILVVFGTARPALAAPGDLDTTFDQDGSQTTAFTNVDGSSAYSRLDDLALQPDGKILAFGTHLVRYNADGTLDASFGQNGKVDVDFRGQAVALQPDGKILAAGSGGNINGDFFVARYNADGTLDASFGQNGKLTTNFGDSSDSSDVVWDLVLQPDGKIVAAGSSYDYGAENQVFALARYEADGNLDPTFGQGGKLTTDFGPGEDIAYAVALQPDGKLVAAGPARTDTGFIDFAVVRYEADGNLDPTFGQGGKTTTGIGTGYDEARDLVLQPDGKIVVAGYSYIESSRSSDFVLVRYDSDGSLDPTFDSDGKLNTDFGSTEDDQASSLALQPDGKLVAAGDTYHTGSDGRRSPAFAVARYAADGTPDALFGGGDGKITTDLGPNFDGANEIALQPDGKLVAAGNSVGGSTCVGCAIHRFALARYYGGDDAEAPGPITDFAATAPKGALSILLSWTNPTDADADATKILRSRCGFVEGACSHPANHTKVYEGPGTSYTDTGLDVGTYYYTAYARDDNGNWSVAAKVSAVADDTRPIVTIDAGPQDHGLVGSSSATFEFSSDTPGAPFECSLDNATFEECSSPITYTGLSDSVRPDGSAGTIPPHTFRVRAANASGAFNPPATRTWYVDTTPPRVEIDHGPHGAVNTGYYNKTDAGFLWNLYDANWNRDECSLDGAPFGPCPGNDRYQSFYQNLPDGEHTFRVRSIDRAGNVGEDSSTWVVDTRAPVTSIDSGPAGAVSAGTARFELSSAGGSPVTFRCRLDGAAFVPCGAAQEYTDLANGEHTFSAQATDRAGNVGPVESRTWTVAPDRAGEEVGAGGTLTTDADGEPGATPFDPLETTITSPVAGTVSVVETAATGQAPVGYSFLGQQANITAPSSTPEVPLRLVFRVDPSLLPAGADHDSIEVFRNGARVETCADQSGTASPNPCVLGREVLAGGDIEVTVLTAAASYWNLGVVDTVAPRVKSVTPADLAKNAGAGTNVTATFSEAMKASTINTGSFVLVKRGTTTRIGANVIYAATAKKATLNPKRDLKPGATYVATIKGGAAGATDVMGNALADDKVWTFTVKRR